MATQENLALSSTTLEAQETGFVRSVSKVEKREKKTAADILSALKLVEEQLTHAKDGVNSAKVGGKIVPLKPSHESFEKSMAEMTFMLQLLQVKLAKYSNNQASMNGKISETFVKSSEKSLKDLENKLAKIAKKQHDHSIWSDIAKGFEYLVAAVTAVAGVLLCQPELLVIAALSFLSASGLLSDATKGVAKLLEDMGMSSNAANLLAASIMCVVVVLASVLACDPEEAGEEIADTATEMTDLSASGSEDIAEDVEAQSSNGMMDKLSNTKFGKALKALGPRGRIAIMASATALSSTNAVQDAYIELETHGMSPSEVQEWKKSHAKQLRDIEIIVEAVTLVATTIAGLGAGMSGAGKGIMSLSSDAANIARVGQKIGLTVGILGSSVAQIGEGAITIQQGELEKGLSKDRASLDVLKVLTDMLSDSTSANQKQLASEAKTQKTGDRSQMKLNAGIEQLAQNAVYFSPV